MAELSYWKVGDEIYKQETSQCYMYIYYKNMYYILKELQWFMT